MPQHPPSAREVALTGGSVGVRASRAVRVVVAAAMLTGSLAFAPTAALASKYSTDRIGGIPLSAGLVPSAYAPDITARSGTLIGPGGRVLWTRKAEVRRRIASTTKVMTALLVLENCGLSETVRVSAAADRTPYGTGLHTGERRSVRKLLELTLVASSNDAATALAIHVGGSVSGFSKMMNARAKQLGLTNTHFMNPHGLDARGHYSSATDMNKLMRVALKEAEFKRIIKLRSVYLPRHKTRRARRIRSTNKLWGDVSGLLGGKTGFTNDARYCFVSTARRNGITLTSVVLGSSSSSARFTSSRRLLEWGFKHYRLRQVCTVGQTAGSVPVSVDPSQRVSVRYAKTTLTPVLDVLGPVGRQASLQTSVTVPVFAGQKLGVVRFIQNSQVIATVDAVAVAPKASAEETVGTVPVEGSPERSVVAKAAASTAPVAAYDATRPVDRTVALYPSVALPVSAGQILGEITYTQDGRVLVVVPAVAAESLESAQPL